MKILFLVWGFFLLFASTAYSDTCANAAKTGVYPCDVVLSWIDNATTETNQVIDRQLNGGAWTRFATVGANITSVIDTTVNQSKTVDNNYCWRVAATNLDASGNPQQSAWSNISCFLVAKLVAPIAPPAPPSGLTTAALSGTSIQSSWSDNSLDETKFLLTRKGDRPPKTITIELAANTDNYTDEGLKKKVTYCYRLQSINDAGASDYSNESCATTKEK